MLVIESDAICKYRQVAQITHYLYCRKKMKEDKMSVLNKRGLNGILNTTMINLFSTFMAFHRIIAKSMNGSSKLTGSKSSTDNISLPLSLKASSSLSVYSSNSLIEIQSQQLYSRPCVRASKSNDTYVLIATSRFPQ